MNRLLALLLVLSLPLLLLAEEKQAEQKANTLTAEEAKEGWLLLFDGESTFGWKIEGEAKVSDGALVVGGEKATVAALTTTFGDCKLQFEHDGVQQSMGKIKVSLVGVGEGGAGTAGAWHIQPGQKGWARAEGSVSGGDTPVRTILRVETPAGAQVALRNIKLKPTGARPLFNGKDLDGWKVFEGKGKKSKYTVTEEGWLNVKDGPGDLQTKGLYDYFVLQLECISNGKRLNSGVFFRCIPGQYQKGYEAQIHNGWTERPMKTYTIEEFDPTTHKSLGKKKVKSAAMDYGTGAIYRRVPARRAVAKDGEWFTMTVAARERHLATWVNGVQVVDWTDNRPANDNARDGYRGKAGAISIQGHDPTTDLSFRNLRIAEIPRTKK